MITGMHALLYTPEAEQLRAFFRDVLGFPAVDAGEGWLIFALPPGELGVHPSDDTHHELSFTCDDVHATVAELTGKGVEFTGPVTDQGYGLVVHAKLPGGGEIAIYQPQHPTAM